MRMVRNTKAGKIALWAALVAVLILGASACGGDESSTEPASPEPAATERAATETAQVEPGSVDLDVVAGSYIATYDIEGSSESYPASFTIAADGTIEGEGEMAGGWGFTIAGSVDESGEFVAIGDVEGAAEQVSWSGSFDTSADPITVSGSWTGQTMKGSWSATKR